MAPKESSFIQVPTTDLFLVTCRLPPQDVQRIPITVRLMMILSKSNSAIGTQGCQYGKLFQIKGMNIVCRG